MASKRVNYTKTKNPERFQPPDVYGNFMADLLAGSVTATKLYDVHDGKGNLKLEYDDPTGVGQTQVGASKIASTSPPPASTPTDPPSPVPSPGADADR
jgi:hypothetical protein